MYECCKFDIAISCKEVRVKNTNVNYISNNDIVNFIWKIIILN